MKIAKIDAILFAEIRRFQRKVKRAKKWYFKQKQRKHKKKKQKQDAIKLQRRIDWINKHKNQLEGIKQLNNEFINTISN